ncbi:MAG TPA: hypothetical protein VIW27_09130, partial [Gammaproteobacteria bacterium]
RPEVFCLQKAQSATDQQIFIPGNVLIHAPAKNATCQIDRQFRYQVIAKVFAIVIRRHKGWHRFGD